MSGKALDYVILTDHRWIDPVNLDDYAKNVLLEDRLLKEALERLGFKVDRKSWDDSEFNWENTSYVIFRTTWDYFDRFSEFSVWLDRVQKVTKLINPKELILWNIDKHYLGDLAKEGVPIPPTLFIEKGDKRTITEHLKDLNWDKFILKPVVSGAARHTYLFERNNAEELNPILEELIQNEAMMLQEFQENIYKKGEIALMIFGGKYSHAVLKMAKEGDFRVQDDFGGTLHNHTPSQQEIEIAEACIRTCPISPIYARVDIMWDNEGKPVVGELEMIEPELWFRRDLKSADRLAQAIAEYDRLQVPS